MVGGEDHAAAGMCSRPERGAGGSRARIAGLRTARTRPVDERVHAAAAGALVVERKRSRAQEPCLRSLRHRDELPRSARGVTLRAMELQANPQAERSRARSAAGVWAAQQPLDKRVFESDYDDVELLGKLVTRDSGWPAAGLAIHLANGAAFGAVYAQLRPLVPGPPQWPAWPPGWPSTSPSGRSGALVDRYHPARTSSTPLAATGARSPRPPGATRCSALVLGELERRLNAEGRVRAAGRCRCPPTATATSSTRPPAPPERLAPRRQLGDSRGLVDECRPL